MSFDSLDITSFELSELLEKGESLFLLDIREPCEFELAQIPGSVNVPLTDLVQNLQKLQHSLPIVTICHYGYRSQQAAFILKEHGFIQVVNLKGGIDAWSQHIDPTVKRY